MPIDDDPLIVKARQLAEDVQDDPSDVISMGRSMATFVANLTMPSHIAELLTSALGSLSEKRWKQRVSELLTDLAAYLVAIDHRIKDKRYYQGEEFQALILEAFDQERTNRFKLKRLMLARGLAYSGTDAFIEEPEKETFIRILRGLSVAEIRYLNTLTNSLSTEADAGGICARLESTGLLASHLQIRPIDASGINRNLGGGREIGDQIIDAIANSDRKYFVSDFGERFLSFLLDEQILESTKEER